MSARLQRVTTVDGQRAAFLRGERIELTARERDLLAAERAVVPTSGSEWGGGAMMFTDQLAILPPVEAAAPSEADTKRTFQRLAVHSTGGCLNPTAEATGIHHTVGAQTLAEVGWDDLLVR